MARMPAIVYPFVLVIVQQADRFLLVQEAHADRGTWYFPAGGVNPGESLIRAAVREVREEAGIDVTPRALLWMEDLTHIDAQGQWSGRWRFVLRADPSPPGQPPGPTADSLDARWFALSEIRGLRLRSPEVLMMLDLISQGVPELPLNRGYVRWG